MEEKINNTEYFELQIGGFFHGFTRVKLEHNNGYFLGYYPGFQNPDDAKRVTITEMDYTFILRQIYNDIWNWEEEYENFDVDDGIQWTIRVKLTGEEEREWYGNNKYPEQKEWNTFIQCLNTLPIPKLDNGII